MALENEQSKTESGIFGEFLSRHQKFVVLTGAGISEPSGIPTYRDHGGKWQHSQPIQHQEFISCQDKRQRYWARSVLGWPAVAKAEPNSAHYGLAALERAGRISLLITQNVDRLHQRAGHQHVVDLHGRLDQIICLDCHNAETRDSLQQRLIEMNPIMGELISGKPNVPLAPDGDANIEDKLTNQLNISGCQQCGGVLMPDVVFFGGVVPAERGHAAREAIKQADALLVVGSSLMVYSGYRFCRYANELGKPVAILNQGTTRGDELADYRMHSDCRELLGVFS